MRKQINKLAKYFSFKRVSPNVQGDNDFRREFAVMAVNELNLLHTRMEQIQRRRDLLNQTSLVNEDAALAGWIAEAKGSADADFNNCHAEMISLEKAIIRHCHEGDAASMSRLEIKEIVFKAALVADAQLYSDYLKFQYAAHV